MTQLECLRKSNTWADFEEVKIGCSYKLERHGAWGGWILPELCEQELQLLFPTTCFLGTKENSLWCDRMILVTMHERSLRRNVQFLCLFRKETLETWNKFPGMLLSVVLRLPPSTQVFLGKRVLPWKTPSRWKKLWCSARIVTNKELQKLKR